jgi:hypothetical protein
LIFNKIYDMMGDEMKVRHKIHDLMVGSERQDSDPVEFAADYFEVVGSGMNRRVRITLTDVDYNEPHIVLDIEGCEAAYIGKRMVEIGAEVEESIRRC